VLAIAYPGHRTDYQDSIRLIYFNEQGVVSFQDLNFKNPVPLRDVQWSPDSRQLAYLKQFEGVVDVYDLANQQTTVLKSPEEGFSAKGFAWSPDGQYLAFSECRPQQTAKIILMDIKNGILTSLIDAPDSMSEIPVWSNDGLLLAYYSSKGICDSSSMVYYPPRLKVFDTLSKTSKDVLNRDLKNLRNVSWVAADKVSLSFSDSFPWETDLYVVNSNMGDIVGRLGGSKENANLYSWSHDKTMVAYSDSEHNEIYLTSSTFEQAKAI
jgi:Tol biopolymer transport system component